MKKIILSVAALSTALAQAQVGINEEKPKATLDISVKKDNIDNDSQEGLLIPRVTKEKALKMANNSTTPPVESALIYVNDVASFTSPADEKVNDITEKGYYFWNGAKWVKSSGSDKLPWIYNTEGNVELNYPSSVIEDKYTEKQHFFRDKNFTSYQGYDRGSDVKKEFLTNDNSGNSRVITSMKLSNLPTPLTKKEVNFISNLQVIDPMTASTIKNVEGNKSTLEVDADNTANYNRVYNSRITVGHHGSGKVGQLGALSARAFVYNNSEAISSTALVGFTANYSKYDARSTAGAELQGSHRGSGNIDFVQGVRVYSTTGDIRGRVVTGNVSNLLGVDIKLGVESSSSSYTGKITNAMGVKVGHFNLDGVSIDNNYGLYIDDISAGTNKYAIYTKAGNVRFGDLADNSVSGNRVVVANEDGVLSTQAAGDFESLWGQRENNGVTETYLKPADANGDFIGYSSGIYPKFMKRLTSSGFSLNSPYKYWAFNDAYYSVSKDHIDNANNIDNEVKYQAQFRGIFTDNEATRKIADLKGGTNMASLGDKSKSTSGASATSVDAGRVIGFETRAESHSSGTVDNLVGQEIHARNRGAGTATEMKGLEVQSINYINGTTGSIYGTKVNTTLGRYTNTNTAYGGYFSVDLERATVSNNIQAVRADIVLERSNIGDGISRGMRSLLSLKDNSSVKKYEGVSTILYTESGTSLDEYVGYNLAIPQGDNLGTIDKIYGIRLDDVDKGASLNYSIYTGKGNIRFGDLKGTGERLVIADADGVLKTSSISLTGMESLWANEGGVTKLKNEADGSTARTDVNRVTIDNAGAITAKGFIGYNGATIFPDYVFEKYYTGESTIKADYNFHNLASVESFIKTNGHLPGYKSAKEIASKGLIDLGATQLTNVEKIEELYLHTIEQEKAIKSQKEELKAKDAKIEKLENELQAQKANFENRLNKLEELLNK